MNNQNSPTDRQYSPEEVMEAFGIKKDAHYSRMKFLGLKAAKDSTGKAFITSEQFALLTELDAYISEFGKMDGFINSMPIESQAQEGETGTLATTNTNELVAPSNSFESTQAPESESIGKLDELVKLAAGLAAQRIAAPHLVVQQMAASMTYEDLPEEFKAHVDGARESVQRPQVAVGKLATDLLSQWRSQRRETAIA